MFKKHKIRKCTVRSSWKSFYFFLFSVFLLDILFRTFEKSRPLIKCTHGHVPKYPFLGRDIGFWALRARNIECRAVFAMSASGPWNLLYFLVFSYDFLCFASFCYVLLYFGTFSYVFYRCSYVYMSVTLDPEGCADAWPGLQGEE